MLSAITHEMLWNELISGSVESLIVPEGRLGVNEAASFVFEKEEFLKSGLGGDVCQNGGLGPEVAVEMACFQIFTHLN